MVDVGSVVEVLEVHCAVKVTVLLAPHVEQEKLGLDSSCISYLLVWSVQKDIWDCELPFLFAAANLSHCTTK